jgi:hypothetical protein
MIDTDDAQKRIDLLHSVTFCCVAAVRSAAPNATTHAHICINCHSAAGADNRPCTPWFALEIYAAIGGCKCLFRLFHTLAIRPYLQEGYDIEPMYFPRERHAR